MGREGEATGNLRNKKFTWLTLFVPPKSPLVNLLFPQLPLGFLHNKLSDDYDLGSPALWGPYITPRGMDTHSPMSIS